VTEQSQSLVYAYGGWEIDLSRRELRLRGTQVAVGSRAFEIIETLVRADGGLVNKYDLIGKVWPGLTVEENTLQFHVSAVRKALGADRNLLKTVSGRGYRLTGKWAPVLETTSQSPIGTALSGEKHRTNLPLASAPLVGRKAALHELSKALQLHRTVTLTGPGGIGKSALAIEMGRLVFPTFSGDCMLIELASLTSASLLPSAATHALGLRLGGDEISFEAVAHAIGPKKLLLILDNCEHLIDAAARFAHTLVCMCPNASILATSREALRIEGEYVYGVPPLEVPPPDFEEVSKAEEYGAVQLFLARMGAVNLGLTTKRDDVTLIVDICRSLDGIPLAIEFAAARAAALGLEEVAARLDDRFRLLTSGRRNALARHQTLRATLDWSYELLTEHERRLLRRLGVFVAGFTLDAAIFIMKDTDLADSEVVEQLANLVAKSLVAVEGSARWRLLETLRAYALEKIAEAGETERIARCHAQYFQHAIARAALDGGIHHMEILVREIDNVRAAVDWSFSSGGDQRIGVGLTADYAPVWIYLALMTECRDRTRRALSCLASLSNRDDRVEMQLQIALGTSLVFTMGSVEATTEASAAGFELAKALDDYEAQLRALWALWLVQFNIGQCRTAQRTAEQFCAIARGKDDPASILVGDRLVGASLQYQGRQREAKAHFERVLQAYANPVDQHDALWFHYDQRALARSMRARVLWLEGLLDQAAEEAGKSLEEAGAAARGLSLLYPLAWTIYPILLTTGNLQGAADTVEKVKDIATRHNAAWWKALARCLEGRLLIKRGRCGEGAAALRHAFETYEATGWTVCYPELLGALAEGLSGLGESAEAARTIDRALARAEAGGECWYVPELLRVKAQLAISGGIDRSRSCAERCLTEGLDRARSQGALFWELRCALDLAHLKSESGLPKQARNILAPVYEKFTEGFETADLRSARLMLDRLSRSSALMKH
jgi:predicted ATPase/DNA-binding winged helix-turn-helix (wHTH) protein